MAAMMTSDTKNRVTVKLFAGFELTTDLRIQFNQNSEWKQAVVSNTTPLKSVCFHEKDYIGLYLEQNTAPLKRLMELSQQMKQVIEEYCPEINTDKLKPVIFPQIFVY